MVTCALTASLAIGAWARACWLERVPTPITSQKLDFLTAQGRNELIEKFAKASSMIPLWWLGQKLTNGPLAAMRDKTLQEKYGSEPGLLVDRPHPKEPGFKGMLKHIFPEANKYYDVYQKVKDSKDTEFVKDVYDKHAKTVYQGLGLHSLIMFSSIMFSQWLTKRRVKKELAAS